MNKTFLPIICSLATTWSATLPAADFQLAKDGQAVTEIVTGPNASPALIQAAKELAVWAGKISGAEFSITETPSGNFDQSIFLQVSPDGFEDDLSTLADSDGYAVRLKDDGLHLIGLRPRAVRHGVYRMLFRNSDIIWARPSATYFTPNPNFTLTQTDYLDKPAFVNRSFSLSGYGDNAPDIHGMYEIHNALNPRGYSITPRYPYEKHSWLENWDLNLYGNEGHGLMWQFLNPQKYFADHPEFYAEVGGERVSHTHPCYNSKGAFEVFKQELKEAVDSCPPEVMTFYISEADAFGGQCTCQLCTEPIIDSNGQTVTPSPATNFYRFLNRAAAELEKIRPGAEISSHAYFSTETAPQIEVADNIVPDYCPIFQNMRKPMWDEVNNQITSSRFQSWVDRNPRSMTGFFYYGLTPDYPRPTDRSMLQDLHYMQAKVNFRGPLVMVHEETGKHGRPEAWDFNAIYYWVMAQAFWEMPESPEALRREFLDRVFGPAADAMEEFYKITEKHYFDAPGESTYQDAGPGMWKQCILNHDLADDCRTALNKAFQAAENPEIKDWISRMQNSMEQNIAAADYSVKADYAPEVTFDPDFASGPWKTAQLINRYSTLYDGQGQLSSLADSDMYHIKLLYDDNFIYAGFRGVENSPLPSAGERKNFYLEMEITCDREDVSYSFSSDADGNTSDSIARHPWGDWNAEGFTSTVAVDNNVWSIMLAIPRNAINFDPAGKNMGIKFRVQRHYTLGMAHGSLYNWPDLLTDENSK